MIPKLETQTRVTAEAQLNALSADDKMATCGCVRTCPNATSPPSVAVGHMSGNFTTNVSALVVVKNVGDKITLVTSNTTSQSRFNTKTEVCAGYGNFYGNDDRVRSMVDSFTTSAVQSRLDDMVLSYNVPFSVRLVENYPFFMNYTLHNFTFTPRTNITTLVTSILMADKNGTNVTYHDSDMSNPREVSVM